MIKFENKKDFVDLASYLYDNTKNLTLNFGKTNDFKVGFFEFILSSEKFEIFNKMTNEYKPDFIIQQICDEIKNDFKCKEVTFDYCSEENCYFLEIDDENLSWINFTLIFEKYQKMQKSFGLIITWKQYYNQSF